MTVSGLMVTLPHMVDLALGSPEVGAVNFNILSAVLQVIIKEMRLTDYLVEYRGPDKERVEGILSAKTSSTFKITEVLSPPIKSLSVPASPKNNTKIGSKRKASELGAVNHKVVIVEPGDAPNSSDSPKVVVGVSQNYIQEMQSNIDDLKQKMDEILEIPNNTTLIDAVRRRGSEKTKAISDMWQALNITKRVDAVEKGLDKLSSMVEDLIQDIAGIPYSPKSGNTETVSGSTSGRLKAGASGNELGNDENADEDANNKFKIEGRASIFSELNNKVNDIDKRVRELESHKSGSDPDFETKNVDVVSMLKDVTAIKASVKKLETDVATFTKALKGKNFVDLIKDIDEIKFRLGEGGEGEEIIRGSKSFEDIDEKLLEYNEKLQQLDDSVNIKLNKLQDHVAELQAELNQVVEKANMIKEDALDTISLGEMFNKLLKLQEEIEFVTKASENIKEIIDEKQLTIDALVEQIDILKTAKADREDLEDALADKADTQHMNRKVSHDQFDAACDDLNKNIEETMNKLTQQEQLWHGALDEIQTVVGAKLDKMEFDPLRDFVNKKIKSLQERLKTLISLKAEQEAAGTKSKLLKNLNCISCDKEVVMYKENKFPTFSAPGALPPTKSIKPYITYELDAVRKQQKALPGSRNLNSLESALHEKSKEKPIPADKSIPPGHLCNRYCGGSHTMTMPQQRVAHIGHFLTQWGPHAVPLEEGTMIGSDGAMYRARVDAPGKSTKAETKTAQLTTKVSATIQTETPADHVPRMSSGLIAPKRSKTSVTGTTSGKKRSSITTQEHIVIQPTEERKGSLGSQKSATKKTSGTSSQAKKGSSSKQSLKKSTSDVKEETVTDSEAPAEAPPEAPAETPAEAPAEEEPSIDVPTEGSIAEDSVAENTEAQAANVEPEAEGEQ